MASITINLGDAFLTYTPPNGAHLYIAIAQISASNYLFVNITSRKSNSEPTCILRQGLGVPSFIVRESIVAYQFAREMNVDELSELIKIGSRTPNGSCSVGVLTKIQQGGLTSRRLSNRYKTALKAFLEIQ